MTAMPPANGPAEAATPPDTFAAPAPSVRRRLAAFIYEGVLLFGVLMMAALVWSIATQQRHALQGQTGLQVFVFVVLGLYFTWFWVHGGQTVAMKAWHVRLVRSDGAPVSWLRAAARYLLSWLWFVPALAASAIGGLHAGGEIAGLLLAGVAAYAALAFLHPQRQFWHDVVCGTRLVTWRQPARCRPPESPDADGKSAPPDA